MLENLKESYDGDGYVAPIGVLDQPAAAKHRAALEDAEDRVGALH